MRFQHSIKSSLGARAKPVSEYFTPAVDENTQLLYQKNYKEDLIIGIF